MPYETLTEISKATKPWCGRLPRRPSRKRSVSIIGHTHTHACLLIDLLAQDPYRESRLSICDWNPSLHSKLLAVMLVIGLESSP